MESTIKKGFKTINFEVEKRTEERLKEIERKQEIEIARIKAILRSRFDTEKRIFNFMYSKLTTKDKSKVDKLKAEQLSNIDEGKF